MKRKRPTWVPSRDDFLRVLQEQNPWHSDNRVPDAWAMPIERPLAVHLPDRLENQRLRRFELILGPRRVGKTTAMSQVVRRLLARGIDAQRLWWFRLDHPILRQFSLENLVRPILATCHATVDRPLYLFLDELAYAQDWDLWLKTFYDENWPVRLAGTSSSTAALGDRMLESGVGRWEEQYLAPYTFAEYLKLIDQGVPIPGGPNLWATVLACVCSPPPTGNLEGLRRRFLLAGGFPELLGLSRDSTADEQTVLLQSQKILRSDAVERAVYKDIPQTFEVGSSPNHHRAGLRAFQARFPRLRNRCYLVAPNIPPSQPTEAFEGVGTLRLELLLLAIGHQTSTELPRRLVG